MPLQTEDWKLDLFKGQLNSGVADALMMGKLEYAWRKFNSACQNAHIESIEDIPIDSAPNDANLRRLYLEIKYSLYEGDIAKLTEVEISEAKRLKLNYILVNLNDQGEGKVK